MNLINVCQKVFGHCMCIKGKSKCDWEAICRMKTKMKALVKSVEYLYLIEHQVYDAIYQMQFYWFLTSLYKIYINERVYIINEEINEFSQNEDMKQTWNKQQHWLCAREILFPFHFTTQPSSIPLISMSNMLQHHIL